MRALVTGAGSGLGAEVARVLALRGATVWTGCRSLDKCAASVELVRARHGAEVAERLARLEEQVSEARRSLARIEERLDE